MFSGPCTLRLGRACLLAPRLNTSCFPQMGAMASTGPNEGGIAVGAELIYRGSEIRGPETAPGQLTYLAFCAPTAI
jgi:hypothetical protein